MKKMIVYFKFIFLIVVFLLNTDFISALNVEGDSDGSGTPWISSGCDGEVGSVCRTVYTDFIIRVTLVDGKRKKVDGTKTVEFGYGLNDHSYSDNINSVESLFYYNTTGEKKTKSFNLDENNRYDFGPSDAVDNTLMDNLRYIVYMGADWNDFASMDDKTQLNTFINYVKSLSKETHKIGETGSVSFLEFFLHVCGFNSDWDISKVRKKITNGDYYLWIEPVYDMQHTYVKSESESISSIMTGTAKEFAEFAKHHSSGWDYRLFGFGAFDAVYNTTCNFIDETNFLGIVSNSKYNDLKNMCYNGTFEQKFTSFGQKKIIDIYDSVSKEDSPFGVNILKLSDLFVDKEKDNITCTYKITGCDDDNFVFKGKWNVTSTNSKKRSLYYCTPDDRESSTSAPIQPWAAKSSDFDNYGIYCFDDVTYDFSKLKNVLGKNQFITGGQLLEIPNGKLTVKRTCYYDKYVDKDSTSFQSIKSDASPETKAYNADRTSELHKFTKYDNITLSFNGKDYEFSPENRVVHVDSDSELDISLYEIVLTITYDYVLSSTSETVYSHDSYLDINNLFIGSGASSEKNKKIEYIYDRSNIIRVDIENEFSKQFNNKITFNNSSDIYSGFGYSNNPMWRINERSMKSYEGANIVSYAVSGLNDTKKECEFNTTVNSVDLSDYVKFREVTLANPFPARDGTSRAPGSNWLNETDNFVYEYISNNRNILLTNSAIGHKTYTYLGGYIFNSSGKRVNPALIYFMKPIYTIELTPSTMMKIREYNKTNDYSNINLSCVNGRKCISEYLRNNLDIGGLCSKYTDGGIKQIIAESTYADLKKGSYFSKICFKSSNKDISGNACTYYEAMDLYEDGKIDSKDADLFTKKLKSGEIVLSGGYYYIDNSRSNFYTCADKLSISGG